MRARRATNYVERFRPEQKAWIAKARAAPLRFNAAGKTARAIVEQLQANNRENKNV